MNQESQNQPQPEAGTSERAAGALVKLLAIIGLFALLALAAWVSVQVIRYTPSVMSSVSGINVTSLFRSGTSDSNVSPIETDSVFAFTLDATEVSTDSPFSLSWDRAASAGNRYALSYSCVDGFGLRVREGLGFINTTCETPYEFSTAADSLLVFPISNEKAEVTVTFALTELTNNTTIETDLLVINKEIDNSQVEVSDEADAADAAHEQAPDTQTPPASRPGTTTTTPRPTTPAPTAPTTVYVPNSEVRENPNGDPDLSVEITGTGVMVELGGENIFVALSEIKQDQRGAVRFVVKNVGDKTMGSGWRFVATLPIEGDENFVYRSERQAALAPADSIEFTLSFDTVLEDNQGRITIELDDHDDDARSSNDRDSVVVEIED